MKRRAVGIVGVSSSVEELTGRRMWEADSVGRPRDYNRHRSYKENQGELGMVVHTCVPSVWETVAEGLPGQTSLGRGKSFYM